MSLEEEGIKASWLGVSVVAAVVNRVLPRLRRLFELCLVLLVSVWGEVGCGVDVGIVVGREVGALAVVCRGEKIVVGLVVVGCVVEVVMVSGVLCLGIEVVGVLLMLVRGVEVVIVVVVRRRDEVVVGALVVVCRLGEVVVGALAVVWLRDEMEVIGRLVVVLRLFNILDVLAVLC